MEKILILDKKTKLDDFRNGYDMEFIALSDLDTNFYRHSEMVYINYPSSILSEIDRANIKIGDCLKLDFYSEHNLFNTDFRYSLYNQLVKKEYLITKMSIYEYEYVINTFEMMFDNNRLSNKKITYKTIPVLDKKKSLVERLKVLNRNRKIDEIIN
jgi:hypothetical protein